MNLPPLHPIFVNFTAALVPISLLSELLGRVFHKSSLTATGWWALFYAVIVSPFTALAGWYWLRQMGGMDHQAMAVHKWLGTALAALFFILLIWRWRFYRVGATPTWAYLCSAALVVLALIVQGHLGGTMSFASDDAAQSNDSNQAHSDAHTHADGPVATQPDVLQWKDHIDVKG